MFSENTLMLYQPDLQLAGDRSRVAQISHLLFCKMIVVAKILENLW